MQLSLFTSHPQRVLCLYAYCIVHMRHCSSMHAQTDHSNKYSYGIENLAPSRGRILAMGTPPHKLSCTTPCAYKVYPQVEYS